MREVYKDLMENQTDEETWSWVARDILLDTWTALLLVYVIFASASIILYLIATCTIWFIVLLIIHLFVESMD